jgi:hypothetical protein
LSDVEKLDRRKPDKMDRDALKAGSYIVVLDGEKERLYHKAYLRADGGAREIADAIEEVTGVCEDCEAMATGTDGTAAFCRRHR